MLMILKRFSFMESAQLRLLILIDRFNQKVKRGVYTRKTNHGRNPVPVWVSPKQLQTHWNTSCWPPYLIIVKIIGLMSCNIPVVTTEPMSTGPPIVLLTSLLHDKYDVNKAENCRFAERELSVIDNRIISGEN